MHGPLLGLANTPRSSGIEVEEKATEPLLTVLVGESGAKTSLLKWNSKPLITSLVARKREDFLPYHPLPISQIQQLALWLV